jgi:hypothetical protein
MPACLYSEKERIMSFSESTVETKISRAQGALLFMAVMFGVFSWIPFIPTAFLTAAKVGLFSFVILFVFLNKSFVKVKLLPFILIYSALLFIPYVYSLFMLGQSQISTIKYSLIPLLMVVLLGAHENHTDVVRVIFRGFLVGVFLHSCWVIISYALSFNPAPFSVVGGLAFLPYSVMGLANSHTMASPLIGLALGMVLFSGQTIFKNLDNVYLRYSLVLFFLLSQILTTGEGGLLVFIASYMCLISLRYFNRPVLVPLLAFTCAYLAFNVVGPYLSESLYSSYLEHSIANRAGFEIFLKNPFFGVGFEQSYYHFESVISSIFYNEKLYSASLTAHTPYGLLMAEAGLFGFFAIAIIISCVIYAFSRVKVQSPRALTSYYTLIYLLLLSLLEPWPMISNFYVLYVFYASLNFLMSYQEQ